jgi:rSAM/selenodomain-associated transferase 2/rSAM/selenodomain-associated transferase 1
MRAIIYFCKSPQRNYAKTRLAASIGNTNALLIYKFILKQLFGQKVPMKVFIAYSGCKDFIPSKFSSFPQTGSNLAKRMQNAFLHLFHLGYNEVILVGADIPRLDKDVINKAFHLLKNADAVISPTKDKGYYLIGFKKKHFRAEAFEIDFKNKNVFSLTCKALKGLRVKHGKLLEDIDTVQDLRSFYQSYPKNPFSLFIKPIVQNLPKISIIMPVYYEDTKAVKTVNLAYKNAKNRDFEVIVVDTNERTSIDRLQFSNPVRLICSSKGRANQLNAGFDAAKGEIVLFLHADTLLPKNWDTLIQKALQTSDAGAFSLSIDSPLKWLQFVAFMTNVRAKIFSTPYGDQAQFFKADVFKKIGKFPSIPIMEDVAVIRALKSKGFKLIILNEKVITSARRWHEEGLFYTTLRNRILSTLYTLKVSPEKLANFYKALQYKLSQ